MYKVTNKTFQPQPILINGSTVIIGKRKSANLKKLTKQVINMKAKGYFKIKKI